MDDLWRNEATQESVITINVASNYEIVGGKWCQLFYNVEVLTNSST